jgi:hypothetical protein
MLSHKRISAFLAWMRIRNWPTGISILNGRLTGVIFVADGKHGGIAPTRKTIANGYDTRDDLSSASLRIGDTELGVSTREAEIGGTYGQGKLWSSGSHQTKPGSNQHEMEEGDSGQRFWRGDRTQDGLR